MFEALTGSTGITATVSIDSIHIKAHRSAAGAKGAFVQAIGNSRGGRTTKIHVVADAQGRPLLILLTPGNASDMAPHAVIAGPATDHPRGRRSRIWQQSAVRADRSTRSRSGHPLSSGRVRQIPTIAWHMVVAISSSPATSSRSPSSPLQSLTDAIESGA
jgi:hypothetical protein